MTPRARHGGRETKIQRMTRTSCWSFGRHQRRESPTTRSHLGTVRGARAVGSLCKGSHEITPPYHAGDAKTTRRGAPPSPRDPLHVREGQAKSSQVPDGHGQGRRGLGNIPRNTPGRHHQSRPRPRDPRPIPCARMTSTSRLGVGGGGAGACCGICDRAMWPKNTVTYVQGRLQTHTHEADLEDFLVAIRRPHQVRRAARHVKRTPPSK